jgi:hypothetical protein
MTHEQRELIFQCLVIAKCGASEELKKLNDDQLLYELLDSCQSLHDDFWQLRDDLKRLKSINNELISYF